MAEMLLNVDMAGGPSGGHAEHSNKRHRRFLQRRKYLEKRGFLKPKQLPQKPPNKTKEQPANSCAHSNHNGQHRTDTSHSNIFWSDEPLPQLIQFTPSKGQCSSKPAEAGHPPPQPSLHQQKISPPSEFDSGLPSGPSNPSYKIVAIDCEMVGTGQKGSIGALARCSIVGYNGDVVYDRYIRPANPVTDYRTKWSGIRREHLFNAIPFSAAQKEILKILHGKIVIGHAIHNDYKALEYFHPKEMTRDTSKIPLLNRKAGFPEKEVASLKRLAKQLLRRDIQVGRGGHSSVEDAKTTMELYRIVETEYERELASGGAD